MTDEIDDGDGLELQFEPDNDSRSEVYEWQAASGKGGVYIFPRGVEAWADANDVALIHIDKTTGVVTAQHELGSPFRVIDKPINTGNVKPIK